MTVKEGDRLLTVHDVASYLQVSEKSVRRRIKTGELSAYRIGKQLRVSESDLKCFLTLRRAP